MARESLVVSSEPMPLGVMPTTEEHQAWRDFMLAGVSEGSGRPFTDVYEAWTDLNITNPAIRQRLAVSLTAPFGARLPYDHPQDGLGGLLSVEESVDGRMTTDLAARMQGRPGEELGRSLLWWLGEYRSEGQAGIEERVAIRGLLGSCGQEVADRLYARHPNYMPSSRPEINFQMVREFLNDRAIPDEYLEKMLQWWMDRADADSQEAKTMRGRALRDTAPYAMADYLAERARKPSDNPLVTDRLVAYLSRTSSQNFAGLPFVTGRTVNRLAEQVTDPDQVYAFLRYHILNMRPTNPAAFQVETTGDMILLEDFGRMAAARGEQDIVGAAIQGYRDEHARLTRQRTEDAAARLTTLQALREL